MILSGFRALIDVVKVHNNDISKAVSSIDSNVWGGLSRDTDVLVMIIEAILEYDGLWNGEVFYQYLSRINPIYAPLCIAMSNYV